MSIGKIFHSKKYQKLCLYRISMGYSVVFLTITYFAYSSYKSYLDRRYLELSAAAYEVEISLDNMLDYGESVLNYLNRQIAISGGSNYNIRKIFNSFSESYKDYSEIKNILSVGNFYWIDASNHLAISSQGFFSKSIDVSSRDYLVNTSKTPWKIFTGEPSVGAASGQYVIPAGVGVVNSAGKYLGTTVISFKVYDMITKFKNIVNNDNIDFAVLNKSGKVLLESQAGLFSEDQDLAKNLKLYSDLARQEVVSEFSFFHPKGNYAIIRSDEKYSYKILAGYQNGVIAKGALAEIIPHLIELLIVTIFFAIVLRKTLNCR